MSSREQFEAWIAGTTNSDLHRGIMLDRHENGRYRHLATENKWEAWQEATKQSEAKCAALAAEKEKFAVECAATKIAIAYLKSGRHDFTLNTPATDAFLAEVRASALEYYANLFKDTVNMDVKHNQEFHKGTLYVADQFRKGAAQ